MLRKSDHPILFLVPEYRQKTVKPNSVKVWSSDAVAKSKGCFECTDCDIFKYMCVNTVAHETSSDLRLLKEHAPRPLKQKDVKFASLNIQSLTNKTLILNYFISDHDIDILCLSETWHRSGDYLTLNETTPAGYNYIEKACSSGRGGGLAVFYRYTFHLVELQVPDSPSLECLAARCLTPEPRLIVSIYRPPRANPTFISDF